MNYRSVVVLGRARRIDNEREKTEALRRFTNHVVRDRWDEVRQPTAQELRATTVLAVSLAESSAKVRSGPPKDDESDTSWPVWAGVVPLAVHALAPVPAGFDLARVMVRNRA
jgi:nitroimidazol reductase NimA-like FMN-containing flavoprotein (pyridoxamine 5'-phosphate oxidase superfamily)